MTKALTRAVVDVSHHLSERGVDHHNVCRRFGNVSRQTAPDVARVLAGPVIGRLAEQQVEFRPVWVDESPVLDVRQSRKQFQQPASCTRQIT